MYESLLTNRNELYAEEWLANNRHIVREGRLKLSDEGSLYSSYCESFKERGVTPATMRAMSRKAELFLAVKYNHLLLKTKT